MYAKRFRQKINATVCRVRYQSEQWHCDFGDDSSMDVHHAGITVDLTVTASQCRNLANVSSITLNDETLEFNKGTETTVVKQKQFAINAADSRSKHRNEGDSFGWVHHQTFEGREQDVTLKVRTKYDKVMSKDGWQFLAPGRIWI